MIEVVIPGFKRLHLSHLVLDYNGTLAVDGELLPGVRPRLKALSGSLRIHVLTADTFGKAKEGIAGVACELSILAQENQDRAKQVYVERLTASEVAAIGNGRNDRLMLQAAALGIAVLQAERAAAETITAADIVTNNVLDALDLLTHPLRLIASLRT
ncbi:MAG: HAD hydrolase family protein [Acidobacteria bacterium]|nr:HAD hydrolase family protein [Acidobacteriota bacterium]